MRWHIFFTIFPLLVILVIVGGTGVFLLRHVGNRINLSTEKDAKSENRMERLDKAVQQIDGSFKLALAGNEAEARTQFDAGWSEFTRNYEEERASYNFRAYQIEEKAMKDLGNYRDRYRKEGNLFFSTPTLRRNLYLGSQDIPFLATSVVGLISKPQGAGPLPAASVYAVTSAGIQDGGLVEVRDNINRLRKVIWDDNDKRIDSTSQRARELAESSLTWFAGILTGALAAALILAWRTVGRILQPIRAVTQSAQQISAGNLDQVVTVAFHDELGQLAQAFNVMARHLRDYRQSQLAQLLRAQQTSQATIDSFPDPVLVIDAEGQVEMANPAARRMLSVTPPASGPADRIVWQAPESLRKPLAEALQGQRDYRPQGFDRVVLLGSNGEERALLPHILTIRDPAGSTLGAAVLFQDVTRLRLLDEMKSNLVATASHELKTPLTSIRLAVHLLFEELAGPLNPKQQELLQDARDNCERLLAMVNNLLDLARFELGSKQLDIHPQSPEALMRTAAEVLRPLAEDKGVAIIVDVPPDVPDVAVDAPRLGTALRNLVENALTYTDKGGIITLSASANMDGVVMTVSDTGCGIPPDAVDHVFEKFFRVPGQSKGGGTGLGLAIVQEIVTAHGGSITCSSELGVGTVFRLTLPVSRETPLERGPLVSIFHQTTPA